MRPVEFSGRSRRPDLFIIFTDDPHEIEKTIIDVLDIFPGTRIVVLTSFCRLDHLLLMFRLGVHAYLSNTISADALIKSLDVVMVDGIVLPSESLRQLVEQESQRMPPETVGVDEMPREMLAAPIPDQGAPALSDREALILRALVMGDSNKHIARRLDIAEATVKVHVKAILRKIRVRNRTQAAIWAISNGHASSEPICEIVPVLSDAVAQPEMAAVPLAACS